jgi:hypothetical protein
MPEYYLRIEAVNLDYSVYDTYDISTIRGGSFMLHSAFEMMEQRLNPLPQNFKDLGSTASVGLWRFEADESAKDAIVKQFVDEASKDISTFATLVRAVKEANDKPFKQTLNELLAECRLQQYQTSSVVLPLEKKNSKPCDFDGIRPGVHPDRKGKEPKIASTAVFTRRKKGKQLRNDIYRKLLGDTHYAQLLENVGEDTSEEEGLVEKEKSIVTTDLEALSARKGAGKLDGKIAFIYLDGNRFGRIREEMCTDAGLYKEFQETVQEKLRKAALQQILDFAHKTENTSFLTNGRIRLETLLWGGDDIEWIVPAWQALNVLESFFETTQAVGNFHRVTLTHSAGVVFCHHNLPILQIRRYARELCDIAKEGISKNIREIDPVTDNRFAFLNIVSFDYMAGDTREFLKDYYSPAIESDFIIPASEIADLKMYLPILKRYFPVNKQHDMLQALKRGNVGELQSVQERAISLLPDWQRAEVNMAIEKVIAGQLNRWFRVADLMRYIE